MYICISTYVRMYVRSMLTLSQHVCCRAQKQSSLEPRTPTEDKLPVIQGEVSKPTSPRYDKSRQNSTKYSFSDSRPGSSHSSSDTRSTDGGHQTKGDSLDAISEPSSSTPSSPTSSPKSQTRSTVSGNDFPNEVFSSDVPEEWVQEEEGTSTKKPLESGRVPPPGFRGTGQKPVQKTAPLPAEYEDPGSVDGAYVCACMHVFMYVLHVNVYCLYLCITR